MEATSLDCDLDWFGLHGIKSDIEGIQNNALWLQVRGVKNNNIGYHPPESILPICITVYFSQFLGFI